MREHYDVVIVGGRVAGCSVAIKLASAGLSVLIIDKDELPSDKVYSTHLVSLNGVKILKDLGVFNTLTAQGCPAYSNVVLHTPVGRIQGAPPPYQQNTQMFGPRRYALDSALYNKAITSGVAIKTGREPIELIWLNDRVGGIKCKKKPGQGQEEIYCRLLIGADGSNSKVAKLVGAKKMEHCRKLSGIFWGYFRDTPIDAIEYYFGPGVSGVCFGTNDNVSTITLTTTMTEFRKMHANPDEGFLEKLELIYKDFKKEDMRAKMVGDLKGCSISGQFTQNAGSGWALIGDAAHVHDPASATGISDALSDSEILAQHTLQNWEKSKACVDNALLDYSNEHFAKRLPYYKFWCQSLHQHFHDNENHHEHTSENSNIFWQYLDEYKEIKNAFLGILNHSFEGDSSEMMAALNVLQSPNHTPTSEA